MDYKDFDCVITAAKLFKIIFIYMLKFRKHGLISHSTDLPKV